MHLPPPGTKKTRVPRRALQRVFDMACEMSREGSYQEHDEDSGACLGVRLDVLRDLKTVQETFKLKGKLPR